VSVDVFKSDEDGSACLLFVEVLNFIFLLDFLNNLNEHQTLNKEKVIKIVLK
jgi:hypothetical protein